LTVGGHILTRHQYDRARDAVQWYLLPVFEWLAGNWIALFHEQNYSWHENSAVPAATSTFMAIRRLITAQDDEGAEEYDKVQAWWQRHALKAADSSALYPDVYFRRLGDDIEVSWTGRQPSYAPDGFRFTLSPGVASLAVAEVAEPLWQALNWFITTHEATTTNDLESVQQLQQQVAKLQHISTQELEAGYLPVQLLAMVETAKRKYGAVWESIRVPSIPAISLLDSPVLMFGGVRPDIAAEDVDTLVNFLRSHVGGHDSQQLMELVDTSIGAPITAPFAEGYDLADDLLERLDLPGDSAFVDVAAILKTLKIAVEDQELQTDSIRGVAVAGASFSPGILVNTRSQFNKTEVGRRFTLAHELFHVLYDRARASCVAHASGPWALPGIEKRANAFAAMLLMPPGLVRKSLLQMDSEHIDSESIADAAQSIRVGRSALIEHLYNLNMIDEMERDGLREGMTGAAPVSTT
jgi:Zn-dependent peptidase ImmA (M78 family)